MAKIIATCISEAKGLQKHPVEQVELQADWGNRGRCPRR